MKAILATAVGVAAAIALAIAWTVQPLAGTVASGNGETADPERLKADVVRLFESYGSRHHGNPDVLDRAAGFIEARLVAVGGIVTTQRYEVDGKGYRNVIARFGPSGNRPVVIGAHYDVEEHTPGADDNASGVAGLLELARLLGRHPPAVPVDLVAYTLEEPPHFKTGNMGSRRHAAALSAAGIEPRLVVVLEMIGYFDDRPDSQGYPYPLLDLVYPDRGNFIAVVGNLSGTAETRRVKAAMTGETPLPVWSINAPAWLPGVDFSDHASYWQQGIPAVMVSDTAFYRNYRYHEPNDTPDTLDYRRMAQVVSGVLAVIREASKGEGK